MRDARVKNKQLRLVRVVKIVTFDPVELTKSEKALNITNNNFVDLIRFSLWAITLGQSEN